MAVPKKKLLKRYRERIEAAKSFRQHEALDDLWERLLDLYRGRHFKQDDLTYNDKVVVNIAFSTINVIAPSVAVNYPKIAVTAEHPDYVDEAEIAEAVTNYWWRRHDILPEFQAAVVDHLIYGFGWLKCGYRFVEEDVDIPEAEFRAMFEQKRRELDDYAAQAEANPAMGDLEAALGQTTSPADLPTDDEIAASIPSTKRVIAHDAPFVERVDVHDVFVDPEATSLRDARWIAQRLIKTHEELWENEHYKRSAVRSAKPDSRSDEMTFAPSKSWLNRDDRDFSRYTVWEYYDLKGGTMCVFCDIGGDEFLVDPSPQPYSFGHPYIMMRNYDVPGQFYPMGELEALEPLQHELNFTRTAMFNDRKQFRRGWLYRKEAFDADGIAALQSDADNRLIPVTRDDPFENIIGQLPSQQVNPQLYQDTEIIENDVTNVTGINEYMRGAMPEIRRTATEAAIIQDVANARAANKLARVEKVIGEIGRRMLMLAQQYLHEEQVAHIIGANGQPFHFEFTPEDIQGQFFFTVEGGSTQPKNEQQRRQTANELLQVLAPFGDPAVGLVNMREVLGYVLREGYGVMDPGRFLVDQEALAQEEAMAQMEQEMMQPPGFDEPDDDDAGMQDAAVVQALGQLTGQPRPLGGPPGGYAGYEEGGVPLELLAQLRGQVGAPI